MAAVFRQQYAPGAVFAEQEASSTAQAITAPLVDAGSAAYGPTLRLSVVAPLVDAGAVVYTPSLAITGPQTVSVPLVDSGAEVFAPRVGDDVVARGFTFQKWKPKLWWVRKPRSLDEEEAEEKLEAAAQEIAKVAAKQIKRIKPGQPVAVTKPQKAEVREAIALLVADMPGFDWVGVYKAIIERLAQEKAEQEREALRMAQIEIERIRQIDDEEVLMLLMEI
jgi:hypothetical protein